ncbi:MAG: zinc ribbon protein [Solirubrobacterales bacterium]|nr:zinc ribbon protein [Solirubrobacterales bacterium]
MKPHEPLVCPTCATTHPLDERFCPTCGMPLVYAGHTGVDEPVTAAHARARKVKKQYLDGDLVVVAGARHQAEAELIQGILLEEGVPSMLRRSRGFDVPDMLAAGPRDVLVPAAGAQAAREVLLQAEMVPPDGGGVRIDGPGRVAAGLFVALVAVALIAWIGTLLAG